MSSADESRLFVLGSLAQHEQDRAHTAESLQPIQALTIDGFEPLDVPWPAAAGVSNGVVANGRVYLASGTAVYGMNRTLPDLADVHELSVDGDKIWISSTGQNSAVAVPVEDESASCERVSFGVGYHHGNQVFRCAAGELWVLSHHVHGRQVLRRVAGRVLKSQGDGGLRSLRSDRIVPLKLSAPHSARVVNGENWIQDSGRSRVARYDAQWKLLGYIPLAGWGRGAHLHAQSGMLFIGISPLRHRYEGSSDGPAVERCEVHVVDVDSKTVIERLPVNNVDQINGLLYASSAAVARAVASSKPVFEVGRVSSAQKTPLRSA